MWPCSVRLESSRTQNLELGILGKPSRDRDSMLTSSIIIIYQYIDPPEFSMILDNDIIRNYDKNILFSRLIKKGARKTVVKTTTHPESASAKALCDIGNIL